MFNWYPWLYREYKTIVSYYMNSRGHHAVLLHANDGMASDFLIMSIISWLMCNNRMINFKNCGVCNSCQLLNLNSHPDFHKVFGDRKSLVSINKVRELINIIFTFPNIGKVKIIWFSCIDYVSVEGVNALLKVIEEPTNNTYFILENRNPDRLISTLKSRCFYHRLNPPCFKKIFCWIKKIKPYFSDFELEIAIKLNPGSPVFALNFLQSNIFLERKNFFNFLKDSFLSMNFLKLFDTLNKSDIFEKIKWLISFIVDVIKFKHNLLDYCINKDQYELMKLFSSMSFKMLFFSFKEWNKCYNQLFSTFGLNEKLHLMLYLVKWQEVFLN